MDNFNKKRGGGGRSFGGNRGGFGGNRGGNRPQVQMHNATCSDCNKACEVPFRPTGDKPVLCSDCFKNKRGDSGDRGRGGRDNRGGGNRDFGTRNQKETPDYKAQFEALNIKLDKIIKSLCLENKQDKKEIIDAPKSKKYEKVEKKVDVVALKKAIEKTTDKKVKKPVAKKTAKKKVVTKKKK
jgi:CxxC-x17-CxxC domain-containing protein